MESSVMDARKMPDDRRRVRSRSPNAIRADRLVEARKHRERPAKRCDREEKKPLFETESDPATLARREKQLEFGKNTLAYDRYVEAVPKHSRTLHMPKTPNKYKKYSRRQWDGLVKCWKKAIHEHAPAAKSVKTLLYSSWAEEVENELNDQNEETAVNNTVEMAVDELNLKEEVEFVDE